MKLKVCLICLVIIVSAFSANSKPDKWKLLKSKNNITSYSGTTDKNGVTPSKVEMTTIASPEKVVHVVADMANYKLWVPYCKSSFLVRQLSDTVYGYQRISAPIVKDRDVAIRCSVVKTGDKTYEILIVAVPNFVKAVSHAIRIQYLVTQYQVYQDVAGTTHIIQVSAVDIGGSIPSFLLNWFSKNQPYETCEKLRKVIES